MREQKLEQTVTVLGAACSIVEKVRKTAHKTSRLVEKCHIIKEKERDKYEFFHYSNP